MMRPRRLATLLVFALALCCLGGGGAEEAPAAASVQGARVRVLRKAVRGLRRARAGAARTGRDLIVGSEVGVDGSDEDYLVNEERAFRGSTYRRLEDNRDRRLGDTSGRGFGDTSGRGFGDTSGRGFGDTSGRGFGDTSGRGFGDTSARGFGDTSGRGFGDTSGRGFGDTSDRGIGDTNSRGFGDTSDRGFALNSRDYDANRNRVSGPDRDRNPYNSRSDSDRDFSSSRDRDVGSSRRNFEATSSRDYDAPRGRDAAGRGPEPTRLKDYYKPGAGSAVGRDSDSQRWLKILAEFLKSSSEGRELLRARADQLLVGADVNAGELPLPLLLVPVPIEDQQCAAKPPSELHPPQYLPPNKTTETPFTPKTLGPNPDEQEEFRLTLLLLFREARPRAPLLPPLLLPESPRPAPAAPLPPQSGGSPPDRLSFKRSLLIRAELTAYYSDYTEPYTVWYDAETEASRVDMHGGTTVLYRSVQPGGEVQRVQFRIERWGEEEQRRCTRLTTGASRADLAPPGLPDPEPFRFQGYTETEDGRLERWSHQVAGQAGELGAARGESLVFRHELLVARVQPDFAVPYKYRVTVDSSVLGDEVDWYEHRYLEVREQRPDASYMSIELERECDVVERTARLEHVDPLREFLMPHRDARCDTDFNKFKEVYEVNYQNPTEEAVRKTLLIWSTRFVESANRQGGPAEMAVNELSVLLPAEKRLLLGLVDDDDDGGDGEVGATPARGGSRRGSSAERFPLSADEVARLAADLPPAFSWKRKGAVTHIRNQGFCKTCWAFAVVAAVEGALFLRTGQLVPLSDQQLADCSAGPHHCDKGNHVINPYERVRDAGIAALDDYKRYDYRDPMLEQCKKEDAPVTKISGYVEVPSGSDILKVSITKYGPNVVQVDSACDGFMYFRKGVLVDMRCNPKARNHAVTAVGYSRHKTYGDYFIVKNSWGLAGNRGYVHLHAGTNAAGVHTAPSFPLLAAGDVRRLPATGRAFPDEKSLFQIDGSAGYKDFLKRQAKYQHENKRKLKQSQRARS